MVRIPAGVSRWQALLIMTAAGLITLALIALPVLGYYLAQKDLVVVTVDSNNIQHTTACGTAFFGEDAPESREQVDCDHARAQQRSRLIPIALAWVAIGSVTLAGALWTRRRIRARTT